MRLRTVDGKRCALAALCGLAVGWGALRAEEDELSRLLDAPLLFVKRHSYRGIHIYDTYYQWNPGGGIYVVTNPAERPERQRLRAVIDATTPETLGDGIYFDPDISWDGERVLFCFKGKPDGNTSIYEIGVDGTGLRRLTNPISCAGTAGRVSSHHDIGPAYLPDGRVVFTSTRPRGLVPCNNTGVDILHVMNPDGSDIHTISVNTVNEFDPSVLEDGRIIHGRWEYVDKTALTQQSLWTIFPDGSGETALFANNMVHPEALLDARSVPGSPHLVAATFTPHNAPPRGSIAVIDTYRGKDSPAAITNFEHPDRPLHDRGNSCEPWPLSKDVMLFSGRPKGSARNVIEIMEGSGRREVVYSDPSICCHSPMLVKPRRRPPVLARSTEETERAGRFYVQDVYEGLTGVERGDVRWLRVIEETSRASGTHGAAFNQTFLISAVLAWSAKNFLGIVPVEADGSAYFEVPSGRALYLQALDAEGRLIQSMRTFVQAAPGVTRSCIGCHEHKYSAPANRPSSDALRRRPRRPEPESWGTGFFDYPSMVQPILNRRCVKCHGGEEGVAGGLDLSGGWTEYFSISYENLVSRRDTQLMATLIAGIDCMNGTARWSARIFPPRTHGSGAAPLAELLVAGHEGRLPHLTRKERDLILAWIDTNGLYHGTWNYSRHGCRITAWGGIKKALLAEMEAAGCARCHDTGSPNLFANDWINLERPRLSRILRAPLVEGGEGLGLGWCRARKATSSHQRLRILTSGRYLHGDLPLAAFRSKATVVPDPGGEPVVPFASTGDESYQAMLAIIRKGREEALAAPRVDMPGAEIVAGECRMLVPPPVPRSAPPLRAKLTRGRQVELSWRLTTGIIGLACELHRSSEPDFTPRDATCIVSTSAGRHSDLEAPSGTQHYALVVTGDGARSRPSRTSIRVP